jgi:hypothetical protein
MVVGVQMKTFLLSFRIEPGSVRDFVRRASELQLGPSAPTEVEVDDRKVSAIGDFSNHFETGRRGVTAWFSSPSSSDDLFIDYRVRASVIRYALEWSSLPAADVLALVSEMTFRDCTLGPLYEEWAPRRALDYRGPGFGDLHWPLGWGCAFQGAGHDRLASRRWLQAGPWRVLRGPNDTTLVQLHDTEADAATALEQAEPGHRRMGITAEGGYLEDRTELEHAEVFERGLYDASEKRLRVVVHGRPVPASELLEAAELRALRRVDPARPIEHVAYVFMTEGEARAHLDELWLRELECWAVIAGEERRLDLDYTPPPLVVPEWVRRVEEREARSAG